MGDENTLERGEELARIAAALDDAAKGNGRVLVIEGQAGIGKTHLLRATRELAAERGFGRLQAIGDELEAGLAWGVVRQMVERSISRYSGEVRDAILAGPTGKALAALDAAPTAVTAGDAEVARTLHALWWVAVDLSSTRPLLISVDDAQWSDLPSIRFLAYLARRVADLPIALVVATRPPAQASGPLAGLADSRQADRVLPGPLSPAAVAELGTSRGTPPAPAVVDALHAACGGNPFLTGALLDELAVQQRDLADPATADEVARLGPAVVSRSLLARLPDQASRLAGAAAVLGSRCDPWLAATVAGLPIEELSEAVEVLVTGHVMTSASGVLEFSHPVIREAVLSGLGAVQAGALHAAAARSLHGERIPADRVAAHLALAPRGTLPNAAAIYRQAATMCTAAGDDTTAAAHLRRAFGEDPGDAELEGELGLALLRAGETAEARDHLRAAAVASDLHRARLLGAAASATAQLDGPASAVRELSAHLAQWPTKGREPARLALEARLGVLRQFLPEQRVAAVEHLAAFATLEGATPDERTLLGLLAQSGRFDGTDHTVVAATASRALCGGSLFEDGLSTSEGMVGWVLAVMALSSTDRVDEARVEIAAAQERVRHAGSPVDFAMVANTAMFQAWRCGDVTGTEAHAEAAVAAIAPWELTPQVHAIRATAAHLGALSAFERRDRDHARHLVATFDAETRGAPTIVPVMWLHEARARIALGREEYERALAEAYALRDAMASAGMTSPMVPWRAPAAFAMLRLGRDAEATTLAREHLEVARQWGAPSDVGAGLRLLARIAMTDPDERVATLEEAVGVLIASPHRLELAKSLLHLGEALRVVRRRTDAREHLTRALDLAAECGSTDVVQVATEALEALGDRPRRFLTIGADALTASERRVAELAVDGRTNRDIAQELFVTPKTVENHLGRIYTKLGINGRRQLAGALV